LVERDEMKGEEKNWIVFVVNISKYYINRKLGRESQPTSGFINNGPHFTITRGKKSDIFGKGVYQRRNTSTIS